LVAKSEFLGTLVLGLITTHSSEALNLVLVDLKGGATFAGRTAMGTARRARCPPARGVWSCLPPIDAVLVAHNSPGRHGQCLTDRR
jgi:hypothetical protein